MNTTVDFLINEHRETERQLAVMASLLGPLGSQGGSESIHSVLAEVDRLYQILAADLYRHFVLEEQALFALLSPYRSMMLMEVEHDDLLTLQRAFATSLQASLLENEPEATLMISFQAWRDRLQAHILEEDRGIFPLAQSSLVPEEQVMSRRILERLVTDFESAPVALCRVSPTHQVRATALLASPEKPIRYETLYEREQSSVQHLSLQAGYRQNLHWVGPHQNLVLISGLLALETKKGVEQLTPGMSVSIDSRLYFALHALEDSHLLVFKVWPRPHYTKATN